MAARFTATERIYLNSKGKVCKESDKDCALLLLRKGGSMSAEKAAKYGLKAAQPAEDKAKAPAGNK